MSFEIEPNLIRFQRVDFAKILLIDPDVLFCVAVVARQLVNFLSTLGNIRVRQIVKVTIFPKLQMAIFVEIKFVENHVAHLCLVHRKLLKQNERFSRIPYCKLRQFSSRHCRTYGFLIDGTKY